MAADHASDADDRGERQVFTGADAVALQGVLEGLVAAQTDDVEVERLAGVDGDGAGVAGLRRAGLELLFAESEQGSQG